MSAAGTGDEIPHVAPVSITGTGGARRRSVAVTVLCPFCERLHRHGSTWPEAFTVGAGHLMAHCANDIVDRGYIIDPAGPKTRLTRVPPVPSSSTDQAQP